MHLGPGAPGDRRRPDAVGLRSGPVNGHQGGHRVGPPSGPPPASPISLPQVSELMASLDLVAGASARWPDRVPSSPDRVPSTGGRHVPVPPRGSGTGPIPLSDRDRASGGRQPVLPPAPVLPATSRPASAEQGSVPWSVPPAPALPPPATTGPLPVAGPGAGPAPGRDQGHLDARRGQSPAPSSVFPELMSLPPPVRVSPPQAAQRGPITQPTQMLGSFDAGEPPAWSPPQTAREAPMEREPDGSDRTAGPSLVRPYSRTGGRTKPGRHLDLEALVKTTISGRDAWQSPLLTPEHTSVIELCSGTVSVAEIAARLAVPLGVARVIIADMVDLGLVEVMKTSASTGDERDPAFLRRVLSGLQRL